MAGLWIRDDVAPQDLRRLARSEKDTRVARRLLAIARALDGPSREPAARLAGMDRQTLRDRVIRYNRAGPAAPSDYRGSGRPCRLTEGQQASLKSIVLAGPDPEVGGRLHLAADRPVPDRSGAVWRQLCRDRDGAVDAQPGPLLADTTAPTRRDRSCGAGAFQKRASRPLLPRSSPSTRTPSASRSGSRTRPE